MQLLVTPAEREPFNFELENGSIIVGRSSTAHLALADAYASRHHARLTRRGESLMVEDLGSRNGTYVNGRPVVAPTEVHPGDLIRIAGSSIRRSDEGELISDVMTSAAEEKAEVRDVTLIRPAADILGESSDSIDAIAAGEALRRYASRLKTLRAIHRAFSSRATSRADLLRTILDWAFDLFSPQQAEIYLRASDGELRRADSRPADATAGIPLPERIVAQVLQERLAMTAKVDMTLSGDSGRSSPTFLIAAPMLDGDGTFGMLVLSRDHPRQRFNEEQLDLFVELTAEAALELRRIMFVEEAEQTRLLEHELTRARSIQLNILRTLNGELPNFGGYSFLSHNIPSRGVSGDFYTLTVRAGGDECVLIMGDVSGKGFAAALVTASVEALSAVMIEAGYPPHEICTKLSHQLFERTLPSGFVTAIVAALDRKSGRLVYTNAGQNAALLARPDGSLEELRSVGLPLALMRGGAYESREVLLEAGATLLLYTDGITEAANRENEEYGLDRLRACFVRHHQASLLDIVHGIEADLDHFVHDVPYADDRTVLLVRRLPSRPEL
jgi:serine phosphatase RsbU (regulator of sigma subunit)